MSCPMSDASGTCSFCPVGYQHAPLEPLSSSHVLTSLLKHICPIILDSVTHIRPNPSFHDPRFTIQYPTSRSAPRQDKAQPTCDDPKRKAETELTRARDGCLKLDWWYARLTGQTNRLLTIPLHLSPPRSRNLASLSHPLVHIPSLQLPPSGNPRIIFCLYLYIPEESLRSRELPFHSSKDKKKKDPSSALLSPPPPLSSPTPSRIRYKKEKPNYSISPYTPKRCTPSPLRPSEAPRSAARRGTSRRTR